MSIDELKEIFDIEKLPDEEYGNYQTVGGFVITQLGNIPNVGQCFEWENLRFEVVDMDGRRIDKMMVTPIPPVSPNLSDEDKLRKLGSPIS